MHFRAKCLLVWQFDSWSCRDEPEHKLGFQNYRRKLWGFICQCRQYSFSRLLTLCDWQVTSTCKWVEHCFSCRKIIIVTTSQEYEWQCKLFCIWSSHLPHLYIRSTTLSSRVTHALSSGFLYYIWKYNLYGLSLSLTGLSYTAQMYFVLIQSQCT